MRSANFFTISFVVLLSVLRLTYSKPAIAAGDIVEREFTSLEIPSTPGTINHKALNGGLTSNKSKSEKSVCPAGNMLCSNDKNACCPSGGQCCGNKQCCKAGYWCYGGGCCPTTSNGCDNKTCIPKGYKCCKGGNSCPPTHYCIWGFSGVTTSCCPNGKKCLSKVGKPAAKAGALA